MKIKVLNKWWHLIFDKIPMAYRGYCEPPNMKNKKIVIDARIHGEERLEVLIHEMLHAAGWHLDEKFVEEFSRDAARAWFRVKDEAYYE